MRSEYPDLNIQATEGSFSHHVIQPRPILVYPSPRVHDQNADAKREY